VARAKAAPPKEMMPPARPAAQIRPGKPTVRIIRDSKVTEVPALKDSVQ
jgi:hypothetical protein